MPWTNQSTHVSAAVPAAGASLKDHQPNQGSLICLPPSLSRSRALAPDSDNLTSAAAEQPTSAAASHTTEVLTTTLHCKWFMLPMTLDMPDEGTR